MMTTTRVYVAGSSREIDRARAAIAVLRAAGVEIWGDEWITDVERWGSGGETLSDADRAARARRACHAIENVDVILVLWPHTASAGAWIELGYALREGGATADLQIVIAGGDSIWHSLVRAHERWVEGYVAETDEEAIAWIVERARRET